VSDVTVHITLPRREWSPDEFALEHDEQDQRLGRAIREETRAGLTRLTDRNSSARVKTIEITLVDTARAEIEDDPEAHTP
jgi:hypothetical protein